MKAPEFPRWDEPEPEPEPAPEPAPKPRGRSRRRGRRRGWPYRPVRPRQAGIALRRAGIRPPIPPDPVRQEPPRTASEPAGAADAVADGDPARWARRPLPRPPVAPRREPRYTDPERAIRRGQRRARAAGAAARRAAARPSVQRPTLSAGSGLRDFRDVVSEANELGGASARATRSARETSRRSPPRPTDRSRARWIPTMPI